MVRTFEVRTALLSRALRPWISYTLTGWPECMASPTIERVSRRYIKNADRLYRPDLGPQAVLGTPCHHSPRQ